MSHFVYLRTIESIVTFGVGVFDLFQKKEKKKKRKHLKKTTVQIVNGSKYASVQITYGSDCVQFRLPPVPPVIRSSYVSVRFTPDSVYSTVSFTFKAKIVYRKLNSIKKVYFLNKKPWNQHIFFTMNLK